MTISRRKFLSSSLLAGAGFSLVHPGKSCGSEVETGPLPEVDAGGPIRPPGALPEREYRARCISCGACVNICRIKKFDALAVSPPGGGKETGSFGTPRVADMRDFPCTLCMECPPRCPTGALCQVEKEEVRMGMALIDLGLCFGWNGDVCLSCSKACPLGARVFDFYYGRWGNQPHINDRCVGCGLCVKYCPLGGSAIKVVTREKYLEVKEERLADLQATLAMPEAERYRQVYDRNLPRILARGRLVEREYR